MSIRNKAHLLFGGTVVTTALSVTMGIILARLLGPIGMGRYQMPTSLGMVIATFSDFGIGLATIYFLNVHKVDTEKLVSTAMGCGIVLGVLSGVVTYCLLSYGGRYAGVLSGGVKIIFSVGVGLITLRYALCQILMAKMRVVTYALVNVLSLLSTLLLLSALVPCHALNVDTALIAASFGQLTACGMVLFGLRDYISFTCMPDLGLIWRMLQYGLQLYTVNLLLVLDLNIGLLGVGFLMPGQFSEIAFFSRAVAVCGVMRLIPTSLTTLLYSHWCTVEGEERLRQVEGAIRINLVIGLALLVGIVLSGRYFIIILYGKSFLPAVMVLRILALQQMMWMVSKVFQAFFASTGKPLLTSINMAIANVVSILCLLFLTPRLGITGAAIAVTLGQAVYIVMNFVQARAIGLRISGAVEIRWSDIRYAVRSFSPRRTQLSERKST